MKSETQEITTVSTNQPKQVVKTTRVVEPSVVEEHPQKVFQKKKTIFRFYQVVWYILTVIETLLAFRVMFKAIGADPFSGFVSFVYMITDPFALPFQGIIRASVNGMSIIEWSTMIAAAVYLLIAYGIVELLQFIKPVSQEEVEQTVDTQ